MTHGSSDESPRGGFEGLHRSFYFDRAIAGEITPSYIYWRGALERIKRLQSRRTDRRRCLRNPVLRVWSHWGHLDRKARGKNHLEAWSAPSRSALQARGEGAAQ